MVKKAWQYVLKNFSGSEPNIGREERPARGSLGHELTYNLRITQGQAQFGDVVQINLPHYGSGKLISVRIPPGVKTGTRLRLKDMGNLLPGSRLRRGDVYIVLQVT
ncbi:MAG TPA: DnaJ C-terminal domain-containing protein [Syntrophobacteraceae bacterium]|nr:DnaJ C-terminal domain-containing protein [Syntrophobacteraceae bacterium]